MRAALVLGVLLTAGACPPLAAQPAPPAAPAPSRAQQLMGDVDPKLAELTDRVLFGDVWERPRLDQVGTSALLALVMPPLPGHGSIRGRQPWCPAVVTA